MDVVKVYRLRSWLVSRIAWQVLCVVTKMFQVNALGRVSRFRSAMIRRKVELTLRLSWQVWVSIRRGVMKFQGQGFGTFEVDLTCVRRFSWAHDPPISRQFAIPPIPSRLIYIRKAKFTGLSPWHHSRTCPPKHFLKKKANKLCLEESAKKGEMRLKPAISFSSLSTATTKKRLRFPSRFALELQAHNNT